MFLFARRIFPAINALVHHTIVYLILLLPLYCIAQETADPAAIKKKIGDVRKATNWDNPSEAKKANATIDSLSKLMSKAMMEQSIPAGETVEEKSVREENESYKEKLLEGIVKSAQKGKKADLLMGETAEQMIDEFIRQEEEKRKKKSPEYFEQMNFLCLDMSSPEVQAVIDQMDNFKGITVMLLTGGQYRRPADFSSIFSKAARYPLKELYIIDFENHLKEVPREVINYKELTTLVLFNNSIATIPSLHSLQQLNTLQVDMNPVNTIYSSIRDLKQLVKLGTQKTGITDAERATIKKQLPNCHIDEP